MHCPYLCHTDESCEAIEPRYTSSEFEVDEYCATLEHRRCPFFRDQVGQLALLKTR